MGGRTTATAGWQAGSWLAGWLHGKGSEGSLSNQKLRNLHRAPTRPRVPTSPAQPSPPVQPGAPLRAVMKWTDTNVRTRAGQSDRQTADRHGQADGRTAQQKAMEAERTAVLSRTPVGDLVGAVDDDS
ncbi:hypothetical protein Dda_1834 [Drechslerella dactyloides]|uniref:Uncharacterized protein n=1 Tax=Drechslerella dactyloides TaxID=74499 RepID=A0AAD6NNE3_DREDA|nr:hypothetical protein Dda_1834 [Drechslerella dactyloides]